jgi:hypothetical protein
VAFAAVKDKQPTRTDYTSLHVSVSVLQPFQPYLVVYLALVTDCDRPVAWDILLVLGLCLLYYLKQVLINTRSSQRALFLSYARLKRVVRESVRLIKLRGQCTPTRPASRAAASSLSVISRTAAYVGANPH